MFLLDSGGAGGTKALVTRGEFGQRDEAFLHEERVKTPKGGLCHHGLPSSSTLEWVGEARRRILCFGSCNLVIMIQI